ncbi:MAG: DNA recombination protein RmuC, partial [Kiritimatiellae bacterium]|nr:DNA recombination protein RmuC [Kiritimatiellia bacterium]
MALSGSTLAVFALCAVLIFGIFSAVLIWTLRTAISTLREQFAALAEQKLRLSSEGLSDLNRRRMDEILRPFQDELGRMRKTFEEDRLQQAANRASFERAIADLGSRAMQIGMEAENLSKALKSESKTQGDWGEMVLANALSAAGLKEGLDFLQQAQEKDGSGNRIIPDVEILLPGGEKLLIDSKTSI